MIIVTADSRWAMATVVVAVATAVAMVAGAVAMAAVVAIKATETTRRVAAAMAVATKAAEAIVVVVATAVVLAAMVDNKATAELELEEPDILEWKPAVLDPNAAPAIIASSWATSVTPINKPSPRCFQTTALSP